MGSNDGSDGWVECVKAIGSHNSENVNMMNYDAGDIIVIVDWKVTNDKGELLWKGKRVLLSGCQDTPAKLLHPSNMEKLQLNKTMKLAHLIQIPIGLMYFTNHLCAEYSQENITFWTEVREWRSMVTTVISDEKHDALFRKAQGIYKRYISRDAPDQVNICGPVQEKIARQLNNSQIAQTLSPNLFDAAHLEIFKLLEDDSYKRFRRSRYFDEFLMQAKGKGLDTNV